MKKDKTERWLKTNCSAKKVIVYQNLKFFAIPSLIYEKINPTHKILVWGKKKRRYAKSKPRNFEKIAVVLKNAFYCYLIATISIFAYLTMLKLNTVSAMFYDINTWMVFFLLFAIMFFIVIIIHESLHIVILKSVIKTDYYLEPVKWKKIPIAWGLFSSYFDKSYFKMKGRQRKNYTLTAIFPYLFLIPMFYFMSESDNFMVSLTGLMFLFSHYINLPLEFFFVESK